MLDGSEVNPNVSITDIIMQDELDIYPFLYPSPQQHSIDHQNSQWTTAFGGGNRGAASELHVRRGETWSSLSGRSSPYSQATSTVTSLRTIDASHRRRKQDAKFLCPVPGCGSTFTRSFNLKGALCNVLLYLIYQLVY